MEVISPKSLEEALRAKAERPEAVPIQGGTDLLVDLNFDPEIANLEADPAESVRRAEAVLEALAPGS